MAPLSHRPVSGRYRGSHRAITVELRVDVDGPRPTHRVSADYTRTVDGRIEHVGSMRVDTPRVRAGPTGVTVMGRGVFSWNTRHPLVEVKIARAAEGSAPPPAALRHLAADGTPGASYRCAFESQCFRRAELAEAAQREVTPFRSYDTGSLPSGGSKRILSSVDAFREAGIELVCEDAPTIVDTSRAGPDSTWSDAELHAAMEAIFAGWRDRPGWAVWLLHATDHENPAIAGLMFDRRGAQRQGCAVFYGSAPRTAADALRNDLHTCVHELGHAFNLLHSWQKSLAKPPVPSRPAAASWMNYPERFPGGADAYWSAFDFQFDEPELVHMRHGFREAVIMGGASLRGGSARLKHEDARDDGQDPGLRLRLSAPRAIPFGVPVTVGAELTATTPEGRRVPPVIGPQAQSLDVLIQAPDGHESVFKPLMRHCRADEVVPLRARDRPLRSQPYLHFGQDGFAFPAPGLYSVRAHLAGADGRSVVSDAVPVRVLAPVSRADRAIARLISGNEQVGTLLTLMGSDAPQLREGNDTLSEIIERYPAHPVAAVARMVHGTNLARAFKRVQADGVVDVRDARPEEAARLIGSVIDLKAVQRAAEMSPPGAADEAGALLSAFVRVGARGAIAPSVGAFIASRGQEVVAVRENVRVGTVRIRESARLAARRRARNTRKGSDATSTE